MPGLKTKSTIILVVAIVIIATIVVFAVLFMGKKQKKLGEQPKIQPPKQENPVPLTEKEIQEIMNREVPEAERNPLSDEEIQEIMNRNN